MQPCKPLTLFHVKQMNGTDVLRKKPQMRKPGMSLPILAIAMLLALSGCASKPQAVVTCPRYVPSPQALETLQEPQWRDLASRLANSRQR